MPVIFITIATLLFFVLNFDFLFLKRPIDQQPAIFSYFKLKKGFRDFERPPQQLDAFLYNNSFDEGYKKDLKDKTGILLFGSSQAWGSGAAEKGLTISGYLEKYLNGRKETDKFKVINCGVNGANSLYLGNFFNNFLIKSGPKLVIIDLSNNDYFFWLYTKVRTDLTETNMKKFLKIIPDLTKPESKISGRQEIDRDIKYCFKTAIIEKFILPCEKNDIKLLFVKEPNSPENKNRADSLYKLHGALDELSSEFNIPVVSPQAILDNYDIDNPIWWDFMHLSSLGQRILAEEIGRSILENNLL